MKCPDDLLSQVPGGRVLDAGCGTGEFTRLLISTVRRLESIVGIDPDKDSLDQARRDTDETRATFRQLGIEDLAPDPPRFDTVAISNALHHVPDPEQALWRLVAVLEPGGTLVINEHYSDGLTPRQQNSADAHHLKSYIDRLKGRVHRRTYELTALREMVARLPLTDLKECLSNEQPNPDAGAAADEVDLIMSEYLENAIDLPEHPQLAAHLESIVQSIRDIGIAPAPHAVFLGTRR